MFYEYSQNNSGGSFVFDGVCGLTYAVIIEADSPDEANERAEQIGIYFDGCADGRDCDCCGDRWYAADSGDASEVPSLYGTPLIDVKPNPEWSWLDRGWMGNDPEVFVHTKEFGFFGFHKIDGYLVYKGNPADLPEMLPSAPKAIES